MVNEPESENPDDLLEEARQYVAQTQAAWTQYNDPVAGRIGLKALRKYMDLDALLTAKKVELPREWQ